MAAIYAAKADTRVTGDNSLQTRCSSVPGQKDNFLNVIHSILNKIVQQLISTQAIFLL